MAWIIAGLLLVIAVTLDVGSWKIPNTLILIGYVPGLIIATMDFGIKGVPIFITRAAWPVAALYLLFFLGAVGAGDIKLLSVLTTILGSEYGLKIILISFLAGAVVSLYRLVKSSELVARMYYVSSYLRTLVSTRQFVRYESIQNPNSYICFSLCVFAAFISVVIKEGIIWKIALF